MQSNCKRAALFAAWLAAAGGVPGEAEAQADGGAALPPEPPPAAPAPEPGAPPPPDDTAGDTSVPASPAETPRSAEAPKVLVPPRVLKSAPPVYPEAHLAHGEHPTVVLKVTVLASGEPADVAVEHSAGADFDDAAVAAVRGWRFEPARRGDEAIASRVGVAVHFELPELSVVDVVAVTSAEAVVPHPHDEPKPDARPSEPGYGASATVDAELHTEGRSTSDFRLDARLLHSAPRADAGDLLKSAPGLVATRIEGDGVGHRLMLRGFDADHGQDLALSVDGVPLNQVSHIHGQGYTDLGFLIPEVVRSLRVVEGVYDPAQGDFSVAGSADFELGVERRGTLVRSSYGSFHTFRELAVFAPEGSGKDSFFAVQLRKTRGYGQNRAGLGGSAQGQLAFGHEKLKLTLSFAAHAARYATANLVRRDDVDAGRVGFYGVYPLATTEAQGAFSGRAQLGAKLRFLGDAGDNAELRLAYALTDFRLLANYTGFLESSALNPAWAGRGDLTEQLNRAHMVFMHGRYRTRELGLGRVGALRLELGTSGRVDLVTQGQSLIGAPENTVWDRRVDAAITAYDVGAYLDGQLDLTRYVRLKGGVRADLLAYGVDDVLGNFIPAYRPQTHLPGYRRSAAGLAVGPRAVLEVTPVAQLTLSLAYGEGFRSPQALMLDDGEPAPFAKVRSLDYGVRSSFGPNRAYGLRASGFLTKLSDDIAFDPGEGRPTRVGPSDRLGAVLYGDLRPLSWLTSALSVTYVHATLTAPPAPSTEQPSPPYRSGQLLPYVPPWVVRLDARAERTLGTLRERPVVGHGSVGLTVWSRRPLPYGASTPAVGLLDAGLGASLGPVQLDLDVFNLLDARYASIEVVTASNFDPAAVPSRLPARHLSAGAPRTLLLTLGLSL